MSYKFTIRCLKFSSLAFLLLFLQPGFAQVGKKNPKDVGTSDYTALDALVMQNQKAFGNDAVAMVWTDTLVYKRELGELDSRTLVPLGSVSQWLTAALVLKMAEEGKLSLDDKIAYYLPVFESYGKSYITIRHCLTSFTGIQSEGKLLERKKFGSLEEEVASFAKKEIRTNAGTEFRYSNLGMNIAGRILEVVTKKKFDMLIKQKLLNPLQMRKTTFSNLDGSALDPSAGGLSTAEEFMHFLQMLLNNGSYRGQQILSEASMKELRKVTATPDQVKFAPRTAEGFGYALGSWALEAGKSGEVTALAGIGLTGPWAMIDWSRGYAYLFLVKSLQGEQKKEVYVQMKEAIDIKLKKR